MYKLLIFGGTTEGRKLIEYLKDKNIKIYLCVATEYGESLIEENENIKISSKRLNKEDMIELINKENFDLVIDSTHPYALEVSENIFLACKETKKEYLRLLRESEEENKEDIIYVNSVKEAVDFLENTYGNILVTTGSKEISSFTCLKNYKERVFARVLSIPKVVEECSKLGFQGANLIAMQGPFTEEFNYALLKQINGKYLVTKESGTLGGFKEKINSAKRAGAKVVVIGRPKKEKGFSFNEIINILKVKFNIKNKKKIYLVGIGMGNLETMTLKAEKVIKTCDIIIGAKRMVESLKNFNKKSFISYNYDEILNFIEEHNEYENIVIAYSGDTSFYSGSKKMLEKLKKYDVEVICGISSPVYFASKINKSLDDTKLISMHGKEENIIYHILHNKKVFSLLGGKDSIKTLCKTLIFYQLDNVNLYIGQNLSYKEKKIFKGKPKDFINSEFEGLTVILIENENFSPKKAYINIKDEEFLRGEVPMTKEEIRSLSILKLELDKDSIVYDIGAGTGSVSIEMALNVEKGKVFSIEKNQKGIDLINENKKKFKADNIEVIKGVAPKVLDSLLKPTHAFIGGSSSKLKDIIKTLLDKNPKIKVVINAITLETLLEALNCIKEFNVKSIDITQVVVSKNKKLGNYNLMIGQNPIYIISFKGENKNE